jgi:glycosyltransferase involved in cell wall biosynthesis
VRGARPHGTRHSSVVYVTYDGLLDPLGSSQIIPYVVGLSGFARFSVVSFEKRDRWRDERRREEVGRRLAERDIEWKPLRYHLRPRVAATLWDVLAGALAVTGAARDRDATLVHCRGEVAMLMARCARLPRGCRILLDKRGFFADERVESGSWSAGGAIDRAVKTVEAANLQRADGLVVLTRAGLELLKKGERSLPPHRVIPTCVDTSRFQIPAGHGASPYAAVYFGSLGTWYMVDEMVALGRALADEMGGKVLFLTPDAELAVRAGVTGDWATVRSALPEDVPGWLKQARAAFFLIRPTYAKRASCPTKLGEALATGLPVLANPGIGDVDEFLERDGVGVLLDLMDEAGYRRAARALTSLAADPATADRCRRVAEMRFGLSTGVALYRDLYAEIGVIAP